MKKLLMGLTYYWPNISGVSVYAKILAEELVERNFEVLVLTSRYRKDLVREETVNRVKVKRIGGLVIGKGILMWRYPIDSFVAVKNADIVNCQLPSIESLWLALWAKVLNKKLVVTHHCEFGFDGPISNRLIAFLSFPVHFGTYLMADEIVAYTWDYANQSMFLKMFFGKIKFILPPIKIKPINNNKKINREKVVGFVGRIAWEKGLDILIRAMEKVKAKLVLVGPYDKVVGDKTYGKLKNRIDKKVVFRGPIEHERLNYFYESCDCLVLPSTSNLETFGIVQAEAMKCGTPVVASNLPGVRVPVQMTGMGEICQVNNVEDLKNKINLVLKNGKRYYQKKAKNLNYFDYRKTVKEYEKIFRSS